MSRVIGVIGAGECDAALRETAREVGRRLAEAGCTVINGGLGGVMEAASQGAAEAGGLVIGIVPGADPASANRYASAVIATGMGDARNAILANSADAFIAIGGSYGTLSEVAFALKRGKLVVSLGSWNVDPAVEAVKTPEQAVERVLDPRAAPAP